MMNKNKEFWKEVDNFLVNNYLDSGKIIEDYRGRFHENPEAAYITNVNPMILSVAILQVYNKDNLYLEDFIEEIQNLSVDDFGKEDKIYY